MTKEARELYLQVLTQLEKAVSEDNIDSLKKLCNLIDNIISNTEDQITLKNYYDSVSNPVRSTNLVILACKYNKVKILEYLFDSDSTILYNLSIAIGRNTNILPDDEDETRHNAFYYAIRSCNVELLDTLIKKWPNNHFAVYLGELDTILSKAYEELKLKDVPVSDEMEIFIEHKLVNLRFFSNTYQQNQNAKNKHLNITERIELTLQNINLLKTDYSNTEKVSKRILFIAKFIAQNIHILKWQLRSTYGRLPWEEMEFCLVSFIFSHTKRQEINLFYNATLNRSKILNYLENFAKKLENEKDSIKNKRNVNIGKFADFSKLKREEVVAEIISSCPQFVELYDDYQQIRDIHSLMKISDYIKLALSADPKEREGQLIITRVLQVIGEHLKNTLESPKLSNNTSELLLLLLPKNTREIIIDLRNSLSHAYSLSKRAEIEKNTDVSFFTGVQNDTKRIDIVITDILYNKKIKALRMLLKRMADSESVDEMKEVIQIFSNVELLDNIISENSEIREYEKIKKLIKELSDNITDKTNYEKELFSKINNMINCAETQSENIRIDYYKGFVSMERLISICTTFKTDQNVIKVINFLAKQALKDMALKICINPQSLQNIVQLLMNISGSIRSRIQLTQYDNLDKPIQHDNDEVNRLIYEIVCYVAEFERSDIKWIKKLREKLNEKGSFISTYKQRKTYDITEEEYNNQLALKISELKNILSNNALSGQFIEKLLSYKSNKKLQTVVEMLVLDTMSILDSSKHNLENNLLSLDDNAPLLTGKCLRNHLAHDNPLVDVMLSDPSIVVVLNAKKLTEENIINSKKKIGKSVSDNSFKLREKYSQDLVSVTNQERMFAALEEGNLESLKDCLKKGADINARSVDSWTTLHFAAKGPSLEVTKFILDQNLNVNVKDINGRSPLHVAAAHGRKNIVEFLIKEAGLYVDELDKSGRTSLHVAAQNGHKDTVEILLKNEVNIIAKDKHGLSALNLAINNNHIDVVEILLKEDVNVDINKTEGDFTPLQLAVYGGHLELVNFLLQNNADVNVGNDENWTPLHAAALNGHLEIINDLILKGADINAKVIITGLTPLHYAVQYGHESIVNILLNHGANVNAVDKSGNNTPLHNAANCGHEGIVTALLENKANANIANFTGMTPLHLAAWNGHLGIVVALLKHGVDICAKDQNNATPLFYATESGHKKIAELLIKNSAKINVKANNNVTPLHVAAQEGHEDIINLLIKNRAEVDAKTHDGSTPLHLAALKDHKDIIHILIKNKAEVDAKTHDGITSLHLAALNGCEDAVVSLINNGANVNTKANDCSTPLRAAVVEGHKNIVNLLIKNKAQVDARDFADCTPLHVAVEAGHKEIVEILAANGANVNVRGNNMTPLLSAVKYNRREIVEVLISNGVNVDAEGIEPLSLAVFAGYRDIVEILLENKVYVNMKDPEIAKLLHLAASQGRKDVVKVLMTRGADVDATDIENLTPLHSAAHKGYEEIVEILIAGGANVNVKSTENVTPLHLAAVNGHCKVVKVLLDNKANIMKDNNNKTPVELAVTHSHLQIVKMLLQYEKIDMDAKCNGDFTILHIASEVGKLEVVKYLVDQGSNVNAKNASDSKPIHIAAREGYKDTVEFFLSKGLNINERGLDNQTLLHYAAMKGHLEVTKYLISQGADVNAKDANGLTPMHVAANFGCRDFIKVLLKNGAVYNAKNNFSTKPLEMSNDESVINLLTAIEKLFEAVKRDDFSEVENYIKKGAIVNAKNIKGTSLHYAAWKGYNRIVNILLQNEADPNAVNNKGYTPLHYAAQFSHLKIVKLLLSNGAVYNAVSDSGKTPSDFISDNSITNLFKLLSDAFKNIKNNNSQVIYDLNEIKDIDTVKAIMNACDRENKTLVVAAVHSNFSKIEQLKEVSQGDVSAQINIASVLFNQGNYQEALSIFKSVLEKRKEILGSDNPGTLDIQAYIARVLFEQGAYQEALNTLEDIFPKQKEILGLNDKNTLSTRSTIARVLHEQGRNEEALNIYKEVCKRQEEILGLNDLDTLDSYFHMARVLDEQGKHEEALNINKTVFEERKKILGANDTRVVCAQSNIATVLNNQGKYKEALEIYKEVFEKEKAVLGINNLNTLRTLHDIGTIHFNRKEYHKALKVFQEILNIQNNALEAKHPEILNTQYSIANVLYFQKKFISALKAFKECFDQLKAIFGPSHSTVLDILKKIEIIKSIFKLKGNEPSEIFQYLEKDINIAASDGDIQAVQRLLKDGADVNDKDIGNKDLSKDQINVNNLIKLVEELFRDAKNGNVQVIRKLKAVKSEKFRAITNTCNNEGHTLLQVALINGHKNIASKLLEMLKKAR